MNEYIVQATTLPPSAAGSPLVYGWALFGMLLICAGSLSMMWHIGCAMRWFRTGINTPLAHLRFKECLMFGTLVLLTIGDLPILILWGEVSNLTMTRLAFVDRALDGLALVTLGTAVLLFLRSEGMMVEQLTRPPNPSRLYASWKSIRQHLRIGLASGVLAGLVAIGKVSA